MTKLYKGVYSFETNERKQLPFYIALLAFGIIAPILFPNYILQIAILWIMVLFAQTWDIMGGQMGYNSLGNVTFFGIGMYVSAIVQVGMVYDVGLYTSAAGGAAGSAANLAIGQGKFTADQYYEGIIYGILAAGVVATLFAPLLGWLLFRLRLAYFAIGSLAVALTAPELIGSWQWVGGGGGIAMPVHPGSADARSEFFYMLCFASAIVTFIFIKWLYSTRFKLAINAIRDDEDKAEALGIYTLRHKNIAWAISAFFLGISGAIFGNMTGFIEPLEVAFPTITFGIFMVAMPLLGGKGTFWGPVLGAIVFHIAKELTWTYLLGWQWVALGMLIIITVVFFQQGIMGWAQEKWPSKFGVVIDETAMDARTKEEVS
ncbi:MAG: branched-chain amino acid ABC transporter permease [Rhodospirillales bacterium]|jgi:branched-chain amino acid transport system permease protein